MNTDETRIFTAKNGDPFPFCQLQLPDPAVAEFDFHFYSRVKLQAQGGGGGVPGDGGVEDLCAVEPDFEAVAMGDEAEFVPITRAQEFIDARGVGDVTTAATFLKEGAGFFGVDAAGNADLDLDERFADGLVEVKPERLSWLVALARGARS